MDGWQKQIYCQSSYAAKNLSYSYYGIEMISHLTMHNLYDNFFITNISTGNIVHEGKYIYGVDNTADDMIIKNPNTYCTNIEPPMHWPAHRSVHKIH